MNNLLKRDEKVYFINIRDEEIPLFGFGGPYGRASELYDENDLINKIKNIRFGPRTGVL